ncbi:MAG: helical backbone metal receptor [Actinobacteria bacterium]|nr:helical backbone metal receptor [Actinomycetota bacterium]
MSGEPGSGAATVLHGAGGRNVAGGRRIRAERSRNGAVPAPSLGSAGPPYRPRGPLVPDAVTDELGAQVTLPEVPRRIVSLVPSLSEALWWFRVSDRVVGLTDYCVAPPHGFPAATRVRGTKNPDTAAIADLEPDLVLANEEENRRIDVERLRDAGVPVYVTAPRSVPDAARTLATVGALVGEEGAGAGLAQAIERALDQLVSGGRPDPLRTFCPIWRDPWMATGRDTYAADLLAWTGFEVVPVVPGERYPQVDLDAVRALDPDVVLLPDEPYAFGRSDRQAFADWRARTRLVDGTQLTWYGPRTPYALAEFGRRNRELRRRVPTRP